MSEEWDLLLPKAAQAMLDAAAKGESLQSVLCAECPAIYEQIVAIGNMPDVLAMWGQSLNFDEFARKQIVAPSILQAIGELAGIEMSGESLHAGLQHTYGYLFSLIETPFGYKRARWVTPKLSMSFGLPPDTFTPGVKVGGLLLNVTYFLGRIAFVGQWRKQHRLHQMVRMLPPALASFSFKQLQCWRITETVDSHVHQRGDARHLRIHTDLILPPGAKENPEQLLLYWLETSKGEACLITAFMVSSEMVENLLREPQTGRVEIPLRYNVHIPDCESPLQGKRRLRRVL